MTALEFGRGWPDSLGRQRTLVWLSDTGWVLWDDGANVHVIRRGVWSEVVVRSWLLGWQDQVNDPNGGEWAEDRITWSNVPNPRCMVCQGEGWYGGIEGMPVRCGCGSEP